MELAPEPLDAAALVEQVRAELAPLAAAKGLRLVTAIDPARPTVRADPARLRQVLVNLVGNAVKFTERGQVRIAVRAAEGAIEIAVTDTGIGIAADVLPLVFDEFRQADGSTSRRYGGTGLGLAISRRLVRLHGGDIRAESVAGEGSTFTVRLPVGASGPPAGAGEPEAALPESPFR
jgi:signal transduction histidine kinase